GFSVELKRIVVMQKESGVGQAAMKLLERHVLEEIGRSRIWLDVFTTNPRAIHVYKKLGYTQFGEDIYPDGRPLVLFEKQLK
ncbi:MAG: GNAT family protein, partial [Chloroflexota bacterium]